MAVKGSASVSIGGREANDHGDGTILEEGIVICCLEGRHQSVGRQGSSLKR